jgi:hypothetical protein
LDSKISIFPEKKSKKWTSWGCRIRYPRLMKFFLFRNLNTITFLSIFLIFFTLIIGPIDHKNNF